jgi:hypothetical protein
VNRHILLTVVEMLIGMATAKAEEATIAHGAKGAEKK